MEIWLHALPMMFLQQSKLRLCSCTFWIWTRPFSIRLGSRRRSFWLAYHSRDCPFFMLMREIDRSYPPRESLPLPTKPPYTVHLGNLSFDATEGDILAFFEACQVTNVRIMEDKLDRKPKGFGYAEFATLDGLKKALDFNGTQFQSRNIRISVAEPREFLIPRPWISAKHLSLRKGSYRKQRAA